MRGQAAFEFMIISSIIMVILLLIFGAASRAQIVSQEGEAQSKVQDICEYVTDKINSAIYYGEGFSQKISLPIQVYGNNYTVEVKNNRTLVCSTTKFSIVEIFAENKITNNTDTPPFFIKPNSIRISNIGGTVIIE